MMIKHKHIKVLLAQPCNRAYRSGAAIDSQYEVSSVSFKAVGQGIVAEAIAFLHPVRHVTTDIPTQLRQGLGKKRGSSYTVHVVVAEEDEGLVISAGAVETLDGGTHVRQKEGVCEVAEAGLQKRSSPGGIGQAAVGQTASEERGDAELGNEVIPRRAVDELPPKFHGQPPKKWTSLCQAATVRFQMRAK